MPELPEVEIARRQIRRWTEGQRIRAVHVVDPAAVRSKLSSRPSDALEGGASRLAALVGRTPGAPVRHGKRLGWPIGDDALLVHFGMTGSFARRPSGEAPPPLSRVGFEVDGRVVWFVDGRRFGSVVPIAAGELADALREGQGPDALDEPLDAEGLELALSTKKPVKVALMEQDRLAGLGNIHAAEACFRARLSPHRRADSLAPGEWARLAEAIGTQLRESIDDEDSDDLVYVNLGGPNPFRVYAREGEPCSVCGTPIRAEEAAGRATYWCPSCQPDE